MSPRVSVIIPTYNWSSVLRYSIRSVLQQTMADFELLVVGDGCTDDSEQVVSAIGDRRVRWINLPANTRHQSGPNNEGLTQARADLVAYLGHDDLWLPHHLEAHLAEVERTGAALTHSMIAYVEADGRVWATRPWPEYGAWGPPSSIMHRRTMTERLGGWRDYRGLRIEPDVDLWRRAHAAGAEFAFVPRLTGIKFPASQRRGVYQARPCHEQAEWTNRIESEADFEATLLAAILSRSCDPRVMPYHELVNQFVEQTVRRFKARWSRRSRFTAVFWRRDGAGIDEVRRFKGL